MYIAARGGEAAIQASEALYHRLKGPVTPELVRQIETALPYLVDRVMGEGSLYAPELAALAIAQTGGDLYEAVLLLRAYRSTQPRLAYAHPVTADDLLTIRRISASFKDIPGGQILGPSLDYSHRLLRLDVLDEDGATRRDAEAAAPVDRGEDPLDGADADRTTAAALTGRYPLVAEWQRQNGLLLPAPPPPELHPADIPDVTRDPILFPAPRPHRLQALARADTGGVLALGYASMRGYGLIHPTVNELRLAYAEVNVTHPITGETFSAGRVRVSQGEVASPAEDKRKGLQLGFTATLGWNEVKLIAGATLDMEMNQSDPHPAHEEEFVLYHTESVEASGFCIHFKLPHYVTFTSVLDRLRQVIATTYGESQPQPVEQPAQPEAAP
ncbi:MAG: carbon-phosphorus lyase complex subunit PhnI [Candidatus Flexifilum sp.]